MRKMRIPQVFTLIPENKEDYIFQRNFHAGKGNKKSHFPYKKWLLVARGGIEPPFQEWKSCVLTDRRTGHPVVAFLLFAFSNLCLFLDCGCKGRNFFENGKWFIEKFSMNMCFFSQMSFFLADIQWNIWLWFLYKKISPVKNSRKHFFLPPYYI